MKLLISTLVATALACTAPTDPPVAPVAPVNQAGTRRVVPRLEEHITPPGWASDPTHDTAPTIDNDTAFVIPQRQLR